MHEIEEDPIFLQVKSRDTVLVGEDEICKVLSFVGGARDPLAPTLFQVEKKIQVKLNSCMGRM